MTLRDTLLGFKGRIRRSDWWLAVIGVGVVHSLLSNWLTQLILGPAAYSLSDAFAGEPPVFDLRQTMIMVAVAAPFLWPSLALATKRAHDRDRSARLTVGLLMATWIISFLPGSTYDLMFGGRGVETPLEGSLVALAVGGFLAKIWLLIVLGFLDGTPGPNRFGPSPKAGLGAPSAPV